MRSAITLDKVYLACTGTVKAEPTRNKVLLPNQKQYILPLNGYIRVAIL